MKVMPNSKEDGYGANVLPDSGNLLKIRLEDSQFSNHRIWGRRGVANV